MQAKLLKKTNYFDWNKKLKLVKYKNNYENKFAVRRM